MAKTKKIIINDKVMTLEEKFDCDKLNYINSSYSTKYIFYSLHQTRSLILTKFYVLRRALS